ncbi:MAG: CHAT domain-containing protein, partial [Actinomycetota bacterium]|nr:CHAT domain-containing protein [Actinomycetota bacterium]
TRHLGRHPLLESLDASIDAVDRGLQLAAGTANPSLEGRRRDLLEQRQRLLDVLRRDAATRSSLREPPSLDLAHLQGRLAARRQAALSLFIAGDRVVSVLVDCSVCLVGSVTVPPPVLSALALYADNLTALHPVPALFDPARSRLTADAFVPTSLLERALQSDTVLISPNGILHALPWPSLPFSGTRLFEQRPVGLLPNLTAASLLEAAACRPTGVHLVSVATGFGSAPLPGARAELLDLEEVYRQSGVVTRTDDAVQADVLDLLASDDAAILHMPCHGRADPDIPMASALAVTDGFVDAAEMLRRGVRRREIVLTGCSTGWRPHRVGKMDLLGDDVLGLPGALMEGGAAALMLSITPAADEPMRRLSVAYHRARLSGLTPLQSLASAQRERLSAGDPAWGWCGAVVYGCW